MSRSQWGREQRRRKVEREAKEKMVAESRNNMPVGSGKNMKKENERIQRFFEKENFEDKVEETGNKHDMLIDNFDTDLEPSLDITCNLVSVLPREYDQIMEVEEPEENIYVEMARHRPIFYYVMNNGCVEDHNAFFKRPDAVMKGHLKPLFIREKVETMPINKILVNGGAAVNLM